MVTTVNTVLQRNVTSPTTDTVYLDCKKYVNLTFSYDRQELVRVGNFYVVKTILYL